MVCGQPVIQLFGKLRLISGIKADYLLITRDIVARLFAFLKSLVISNIKAEDKAPEAVFLSAYGYSSLVFNDFFEVRIIFGYSSSVVIITVIDVNSYIFE